MPKQRYLFTAAQSLYRHSHSPILIIFLFSTDLLTSLIQYLDIFSSSSFISLFVCLFVSFFLSFFLPFEQVEQAMAKLQYQLSDYFIPGGRAAFDSTQRFGETAVDFAFRILESINLWDFNEPDVKATILLHTLSLLASILKARNLISD